MYRYAIREEKVSQPRRNVNLATYSSLALLRRTSFPSVPLPNGEFETYSSYCHPVLIGIVTVHSPEQLPEAIFSAYVHICMLNISFP